MSPPTQRKIISAHDENMAQCSKGKKSLFGRQMLLPNNHPHDLISIRNNTQVAGNRDNMHQYKGEFMRFDSTKTIETSEDDEENISKCNIALLSVLLFMCF